MSRKRRGLSAEERALWERVAASARPLRLPAPEPAPPPAPPEDQAPPFPLTAPRSLIRPGLTPPPGPPAAPRPAGPPPPAIDARLQRRLMRGKSRPESRIDLHGMTLSEAHGALVRFILGARSRGQRLVLVITGKGAGAGTDAGPLFEARGVLRRQVPHWLAQPPLAEAVQHLAPAHPRHGGEGALYVYLRRPR